MTLLRRKVLNSPLADFQRNRSLFFPFFFQLVPKIWVILGLAPGPMADVFFLSLSCGGESEKMK